MTARPAPALLITQCLQNDFVKPIGRFDSLPNLLHVGHDEARRLMGEDPAEGPVARFMAWAYAEPAERLGIIHIRDWHDEADAHQESHFRQFGRHCLHDTEGAAFTFAVPDPSRHRVVDSLTLNDFDRTDLAEVLAPFAGSETRVGIAGVWTEAKVFFLCYELATRYPTFKLAVSSALTASSSRAGHFLALDQIARLLGVAVIPSVGGFVEFLGGSRDDLVLPVESASSGPRLEIESAAPLGALDERLLRYLFRDSREARLRALDGGFSGNVVLGADSADLMGHRQAAHVVKIGPGDAIGRERAAFERIESVLGNNAPRIAEFADLGDRGAIKYRYASMGGGNSTTFQKLYQAGLADDGVERILRIVFRDQLGKFYAAGRRESADLLEYYLFSPQWAPCVREKVEALLGAPALGDSLVLPGGITCPNVCRFYEEDLAAFPAGRRDTSVFSYVHGDLNGANIMVDGHGNVWIIDFFHTHRGHILKDLAKFENDLLYIFTPIASEDEFRAATRLTDRLLAVEDLGRPVPAGDEALLANPHLRRAWRTIALLRSFYPDLIQTMRDPLQLLIAQMRYAVHTLSFDESNEWQRLWALYTASHCGAAITDRVRRAGPLRLDALDPTLTAPGRLALTILPGRRDYGRDLDVDIAAMKQGGVSAVVCLLTEDEFAAYGVEDLLERYRAAELEVRHQPILDQSVCSIAEMRELVAWIEDRLSAGKGVVVHCVGGLGRSGTVAASLLQRRGLDAEAAMTAVRRARSPRAIESAAQEAFVRGG